MNRDLTNRKLRKYAALLICLFLGGMTFSAAAQAWRKIEIKYITDPAPTHVETQYTKLKKIKEIPLSLNEEFAKCLPTAIVSDDTGCVFIWDYRNKKIFKFDKDFKLVKTFGATGEGKGQFGTGAGYNEMTYAGDGTIAVSDLSNRKILRFDTDGNHIEDIQIPISRVRYAGGGYFPVFTPDGGLFVRTANRCTLDAYNGRSKTLKKQYSLLGFTECRQCLFDQNLDGMGANMWSRNDVHNTHYDMVRDNRLLVYTAHVSTAYLFQKDTLVKQFDLRPKKALEIYDKTWKETRKNTPKEFFRSTFMFKKFFVDKDDHAHFYLSTGVGSDGKWLLYKFDLDGNLKTVFYAPEDAHFLYKKHKLFYARGIDGILIFNAETSPGPSKPR